MNIEQINKTMTDNNISRKRICEIIAKRQNNNPNDVLVSICKDFDKWSKTDASNYLWSMICKNYYVDSIVERLQPISTRKWLQAHYNNGNACIQDINKNDIIYVESEFKGQYGRQLWISTNNHHTLYALPSRKGFDKLKVGKFYKVTESKTQYFSNNRKRFIYKFEEVDEQTFIDSIEKWWNHDYWNDKY